MEILEQLAAGSLPTEFPFAYDSEYDDSSPWSICLAFFPETRSLGPLEYPSSQSNRSQKLDSEMLEYIRVVCSNLQWVELPEPHEKSNVRYMKIRLRQTDRVCRQMDIPSALLQEDSAWVDGIVRVLQLYRRFSESDIDLNSFEEADTETVFSWLISTCPPKWDLRQRLDFLVMPYLRYKGRVTLMQKYAASQKLSDVVLSVHIPELSSTVLGLCLDTYTEDYSTVNKAIENIKVDTTGQITDARDLKCPTHSSIQFMSNLVDVAQTGKFLGIKFKQLAEWSLGPETTQEDLLVRFLQSDAHFTQSEISTLKKTVLCKVSEDSIVRECVKAALRNSRFMFIKSNLLNPQTLPLVSVEVMKLARSFEAHPVASELSNVITALEMVDADSELKAKFTHMNKVYKTFGLEPAYTLTHEPLDNVSKALESDSQAYLRYTDLVNLVGGGPSNSSKVAERCIEAALADDNFSVALEFFDRKFVDASKSDTAWLAYYQAGKYISPNWDDTRPKSVLKKQGELLARALKFAPEADLVTVLRAWVEYEHEMQDMASIPAEPTMPDIRTPTQPNNTLRSSATAPISSDSTRDHLSNIFKSGIGWVVGAQPPP